MNEIADQALAAYHRGEFASALSQATSVLTISPDDAVALSVSGLAWAQQRNFKQAVKFLTRAIDRGADMPDLPSALFYCQTKLNGADSAEELLRGLLTKHPLFSALRLELVHARYFAEDHEAELALCTDGLAVGDNSEELQIANARALLNTDQAENAAQFLSKMIEAHTTNPETYYFYGIALRSLGQIDEARVAHREAMAREPLYPRSFYAYMRNGRVDQSDAIVAQLDAATTRLQSVNNEDATFFHYGLGKAYEDLGQYDDAFAHYESGGKLLAKAKRFDRTEKEREFALLKAFFTTERFQHLKDIGNLDARPIFIVGMPRSGSTLVEQVLASHSDIVALGELLDLDKICRPYFGVLSEGKAPWADLGVAYLKSVGGRSDNTVCRIVDKGLHNFAFIGFIHILFPNAVILHCERDPMDMCFSSFSLRFAKGHEWSNRLNDTARYFTLYRDLMAHWEKVLPGRIATVRYETLARDFEPQVRQLLEACHLEWDPACLRFHETDRTVRTASSAQVRQPISTASIGRWKKFEPHLGKLKTALEEYL